MNAPGILRIDADDVAGLLPGFSGTYAATVLIIEAEDKIRTTVTIRAACNGWTGESSVEVHETQLTVVAGIEGLDDLTPVLTTKLEVMPAMVPAERIFDLPYVVIEVLGLLCGSEVADGRIVEVEREQARRDFLGCHCRCPACCRTARRRMPSFAAIQRDMAPAKAGIIHQVVADRAGPVTNGVVDRRR